MPDRAQVIADYEAAVAREKEAREHAFLDLAPYVIPTQRGGMSLRLLTVRDFAILANIGDPCIDGADTAECAAILRTLSFLDYHRPKTSLARTFRALKIAKLPEAELRAGLVAYFDAMFIDAPPSSGVRGRPYFSWEAMLVHRMASAYGWSRNEIMDTPIAAVYQLLKIQTAEGDPRAPLFNPSDAVLNRLTK